MKLCKKIRCCPCLDFNSFLFTDWDPMKFITIFDHHLGECFVLFPSKASNMQIQGSTMENHHFWIGDTSSHACFLMRVWWTKPSDDRWERIERQQKKTNMLLSMVIRALRNEGFKLSALGQLWLWRKPRFSWVRFAWSIYPDSGVAPATITFGENKDANSAIKFRM